VDCKRNGASNFGVGLHGKRLLGGGEAAESQTDLLKQQWHHSAGTSAPSADRVHNSGVILPVGFSVGKVRTAERGLLFRLEEVFVDEESADVPLILTCWNQIEREIIELWDVLVDLN
jgi:hypothetical protein